MSIMWRWLTLLAYWKLGAMASGIDIYSQLLISAIRISDINNLHELVISLIRIIDISNCE